MRIRDSARPETQRLIIGNEIRVCGSVSLLSVSDDIP